MHPALHYPTLHPFGLLQFFLQLQRACLRVGVCEKLAKPNGLNESKNDLMLRDEKVCARQNVVTNF